MLRPQPQLDPERLELAAGLYDTVVWQLEVYCDDAERYCLTPPEAARLQGLADLVAWQAESFRRRAAMTRATNQMYANHLAGKTPMCDNAAGFAASMSRPGPPPVPERSDTIDYRLLAPARDLFEEAYVILSRGGDAWLTDWAAPQAQAFYSWCHPQVNWQ